MRNNTRCEFRMLNYAQHQKRMKYDLARETAGVN